MLSVVQILDSRWPEESFGQPKVKRDQAIEIGNYTIEEMTTSSGVGIKLFSGRKSDGFKDEVRRPSEIKQWKLEQGNSSQSKSIANEIEIHIETNPYPIYPFGMTPLI